MKSRTSRSDEGILALTNSVFKHIFGLTDETTSRMTKIIRNQGQWQDLKISVRTLSGVAHRRLNDVVNMAQEKRGDEDEPETDDLNLDDLDDTEQQPPAEPAEIDPIQYNKDGFAGKFNK